ncbi:hypothetical protein ACFLWB_01170 [Chloroflexota bacterium]
MRKEELSKTRVQVEAELILQGKPYIDADLVRSYSEDLKILLEESDFAESKAFLRSFIKKIVISVEKATIYYSLPMPPDRKKKQQIAVLPIVIPGGAGVTIGRTFHVTFQLPPQRMKIGMRRLAK